MKFWFIWFTANIWFHFRREHLHTLAACENTTSAATGAGNPILTFLALIAANLRRRRQNTREDKRQVLAVWSRRPLVQSDSLRAYTVQTALIECVYTDDMQIADLSCPFPPTLIRRTPEKNNVDINKSSVRPKYFSFISRTGVNKHFDTELFHQDRGVGAQLVCPLNPFDTTREPVKKTLHCCPGLLKTAIKDFRQGK